MGKEVFPDEVLYGWPSAPPECFYDDVWSDVSIALKPTRLCIGYMSWIHKYTVQTGGEQESGDKCVNHLCTPPTVLSASF